MPENAPHIAYFTMGFPVRSETAVVREMFEIDRTQFPVHVFTVRPTRFGEGIYEPKADLFQKRTLGFSKRLAVKGLLKTGRKLLSRDGKMRHILKTTLLKSGKKAPKALAVVILSTAFADEIQGQNIGYIHGNFASYQALGAWVIHQLTEIPYGFTMHAHDIFIHDFMMDEKVEAADLVVSISDYNIQYVKDRWGLDTTQMEIIRCGIDVDEFKPVDKKRGKTLRLLSVGRHTPMKGFTYLIDAIAQLPAHIRIHLDLVGTGEESDKLKAQVAALGLQDRITFHQNTPQHMLQNLLQQAHIYVQPSIRLENGLMEGVPATLMEAMAVELPCISTKLSGIPELVMDQETGLLVDPESPEQLAEAIIWMHNHPAQSERMGKKGREKVLAEYDAAKNAHQLGEKIAALLEKRGQLGGV